MPPPDAQFRRELREALVEAYPTLSDLRMLVEDTIGVPLQNVTMAGDMPSIAFELIGWTRARGRLPELVAGAAAERPRSTKLKDLSRRFVFPHAAEGQEERIVREDVPFENAGEWAVRYNRCRVAVCRVEPQPLNESNADFGSGFLVAPDILLTNFHVIDHTGWKPDRVVFRFDCEVGSDGKEAAGRTCKLAADWKLGTSPRVSDGGLDFALLRLAEPVGNDPLPAGTRGWLALHTQPFRIGQPVFILQHPAARPLKLAIGTVRDVNPSPVQVSYDANTEGGSSGSPCFNSALQVVALHHFGGADHNRGVKAERIRQDLAGRAEPVLRQLAAPA
ncbi:serine protease [Gemmata sp. JC673]|uniref:Serine protease n=1 Tax=Gemmata algarum TaxID=2975278 RepID=A0ABU5ET21_9BACT|nr:trypsin-like peptidase domain-containing protein [Gemmata algarum]MDY3558399.1 serine protease [Gemmata algarum]